MYEVPYKECHKTYIGKAKRTLKARFGNINRWWGYHKNGIAVRAYESNHAIDWDYAKVRTSVIGHWQRRKTEAIHITMSRETMNLDSGQ